MLKGYVGSLSSLKVGIRIKENFSKDLYLYWLIFRLYYIRINTENFDLS